MEPRKHYSRSPIAEAVINLRVELPDGVALTTLTGVHQPIEADYPKLQDILVFQGQMTASPSVATTASQTQIGYGCLSGDEKQAFQARLDGFTFSRLAPYDCWETFRDEAMRLWHIYRELTQPKAITRVAIRYINRVDVPLPLGDLKEYLRTVPEVSPDLSQGLSGYFMQLQIPQEDIKGMLVLNEAIVPPTQPDSVSILLDIDLYQEIDIPHDEAGLWAAIEKLHDRTDLVFEACITDRTRELIH